MLGWWNSLPLVMTVTHGRNNNYVFSCFHLFASPNRKKNMERQQQMLICLLLFENISQVQKRKIGRNINNTFILEFWIFIRRFPCGFLNCASLLSVFSLLAGLSPKFHILRILCLNLAYNESIRILCLNLAYNESINPSCFWLFQSTETHLGQSVVW